MSRICDHDAGAAEQVPLVPGDVEEHRHPPVGLGPWLAHEPDPGGDQALVRGVKVVHPEEEPGAAGHLVADRGALAFSVGASQEEAGLGTGWAHHDPPLRAPVVGERWHVLDQVEIQYAGEEGDRWVVLIDDHGHEVKTHSPSVSRGPVAVEDAMLPGRSVRPASW